MPTLKRAGAIRVFCEEEHIAEELVQVLQKRRNTLNGTTPTQARNRGFTSRSEQENVMKRAKLMLATLAILFAAAAAVHGADALPKLKSAEQSLYRY